MMRKLVLFIHTSLDGFVTGPENEIDWIKIDEDMFGYAGRQTDKSDTALYGRVTYEMMQNYWPTAGEQPDATKHDIQHSAWYNKVDKVVISKSMKESNLPKTTIISENISEEIKRLKLKEGKDIVMFGSPTASHILMSENLIDDYWLFINPVLLGSGIPLFKDIRKTTKLKLVSNNIFPSGVICLHYKGNLSECK